MDEKILAFTALRAHIMTNIQLADNKASSLMLHYGHRIPKMGDLYLKVLAPKLEAPKASVDYEIFRTVNLVDIEDDCEACRAILLNKYETINEMVKLAKDYEKDKEARVTRVEC